MDQLRWKRGGAILPSILTHELQREPGKRRRSGPKKRRLRLLKRTLVKRPKRTRSAKHSLKVRVFSPAVSSRHTPRTMNPKQRRIHKRRLASEQYMRDLKVANEQAAELRRRRHDDLSGQA